MRAQQVSLLWRSFVSQGSPFLQHSVGSTRLMLPGASVSHLHTFLSSQDEKQHGKPQLPGGAASSLPRMGDMFQGKHSAIQVRCAGHGGPPPYEGPDPWPQLRASYNSEVPNDLGSSYYALILTFGFAWLLQDIAGYPPRILGIMGLLFFIFYTRRGNFGAGKWCWCFPALTMAPPPRLACNLTRHTCLPTLSLRQHRQHCQGRATEVISRAGTHTHRVSGGGSTSVPYCWLR